MALPEIEKRCHREAADTPTASSSSVLPPRRHPELLRLQEVVRRWEGDKETEEFKKLRRRRDQEKRRFDRKWMTWRFAEGRRRAQKIAVESVEGSVDRADWHASLIDATLSFTDAEERVRTTQALASLRSRAAAGPQNVPGLPVSAVMRARARLRSAKATGPDGMSSEVLKELPFRTVRIIAGLFDDIFRGRRAVPDSWRQTFITLMPKMPKALTRLTESTRSLAVESAFKKWYSSSVLVVLEPYFAKVLPHLSLFGFSAERSCGEISGALKCAAQRAAVWGKDRSLLIASLDVSKRFRT